MEIASSNLPSVTVRFLWNFIVGGDPTWGLVSLGPIIQCWVLIFELLVSSSQCCKSLASLLEVSFYYHGCCSGRGLRVLTRALEEWINLLELYCLTCLVFLVANM